MREQRVVLKHHADFALVGWNVVHQISVDQNLATVRAEETGDQIEQSRLSAAGRPKQSHKLAKSDCE